LFIGITEEQINQALKNIYNRVVDTTKEIEPTLFKHAQQNLNKSVDMAFGSVEFGTPDYDFVNQLKNNNAVFAAFKTHREQNDLIPKLWDDKGKLRSFEEFKKANKHIVSKYDHWLRTEYNTAVVRARNASNFKKFNRDADLYPNLEWLPSTSIEPRDEHRKFYGLVLPINDPFWQTHYPGNLWNCKCGITNTDKEPSKRTPTANYTPPQGLEENPASTGALFSNKNMYVKNAYRGAEEAVERHVRKEILNDAKEVLRDYRNSLPEHNGITLSSDKLITGEIKILRKSVREVGAHIKDVQVYNYLPNIEKELANWKYEGWNNCKKDKKGEEGKTKHNESDFFLYYTAEIGGVKRYFSVMWHNHYNTETLYCITNRMDDIKKGLPPEIKKRFEKNKKEV
jgi:hypothetical protein